ncbi:MAG: alpha/beta fold hydrolase [Frankiales bacterium]|nr:alpha/beta fold hydrolase [Frankiales bacterium]
MPRPSRTGTVLTADGERISVAHDRAVGPAAADDDRVAFVLAHGFTGGWRRPDVRAIAGRLARAGDVVSYDSRGHGASSGLTTLGDSEVLDLDAAVGWARWLGRARVVTVGFSMGGSVVLRQAALAGARERPEAVVSVSAAGFWFYRGTPPMRLLHRAVETPLGRGVLRLGFHTRVTDQPWEEPYPLSPSESAAMIAPLPLLVVHGDRDLYFPVEHARSIVTAAAQGARERGVADRTREWIEPGVGHAESAMSDGLVDRIAAWAVDAVRAPAEGPR